MSGHKHAILHFPKTKNGDGWAVCECGATQKVERGRPVGGWHVCEVCTAPWGLPADFKPGRHAGRGVL